MATRTLSHQLWWVMGLLVLVTPLLLNQTLNRIEPAGDTAVLASLAQAGTTTELPAALPMRFQTQMVTSHQALPNGWHQSQYVNQLRDSQEGLVPYIPRMFNLDHFTPLQQNSRTIGGTDYGRLHLRQKFSPRHYLAYYQFQVGDTRTNSYTRAKLYQIPAALRGAQVFTLTIWQRQCQQSDCQQESQQLEAWLATQPG